MRLNVQPALQALRKFHQLAPGMPTLYSLAHLVPTTQNRQAASGTGGGAWMGVLGLTVTPPVAQAMELPSDLRGILVEQMERQGPADQTHLQAGNQVVIINGHRRFVGGDIIVSVDGQRVHRLEDMQTFLQQAQPGQVVTLTLLRNKEWMQVKVVLGNRSTFTPPTSATGGITA